MNPFILLFILGVSLKCYTCNNDENKGCGDPFNFIANPAQDLPATLYCVKVVTKVLREEGKMFKILYYLNV